MKSKLQGVNEGNWPSRSLYYVCRNFTHLADGEDYDLAMPSIHIGLLDFTLFNDHPAFYSSFKFLETKKHYEYTDKLQIRVLDLTRTDLATKEDKASNIDKWAQLFKARNWEEIKMLAVKDKEITEAATTIYQISEDERIRQQCEAREDYLRRQKGLQRKLAKLDEVEKALAEKEAQLEQKDEQLEQKDAQLDQKDAQLEQKDTQIDTLEKEVEMLRARLEEAGLRW